MNNYHNLQSMHFKHITLVVSNLERSIHFYHEILGFSYRIKDNKAELYADQNALITLIEDTHVKKTIDVYGLYHVAFLLPSKKALANILNRLFIHQYQTSGLTDHGVSIAIYLDDPDGNGIEIYIDKDEALWPRINGELQMYTKGYPLNDVIKHLEVTNINIIDPHTVIGHLHFFVPSLDEARDFYVDLLGFTETQFFMNSALFISDKEYHHHLGLNTWLKNSKLRDSSEPGLLSYRLYLPKASYDRLSLNLKSKNIDINDFKDPLGHHIQIITEK